MVCTLTMEGVGGAAGCEMAICAAVVKASGVVTKGDVGSSSGFRQ